MPPPESEPLAEPEPLRQGAPRGPAERRRFRDLPPWVQGWTAVIGIAIAAIGLGFTAIQVLGDRAPAPTPIVIKPEAFIEVVTVESGQIEAAGGFRSVDIASEIVLFIGRPLGVADARWVPVEAAITPQPSASGTRVDGRWTALRPFTEPGRFSWRALVVPAGSAAAEGYEDIKVNGPLSEDVLAASEEFVTGEEP